MDIKISALNILYFITSQSYILSVLYFCYTNLSNNVINLKNCLNLPYKVKHNGLSISFTSQPKTCLATIFCCNLENIL